MNMTGWHDRVRTSLDVRDVHTEVLSVVVRQVPPGVHAMMLELPVLADFKVEMLKARVPARIRVADNLALLHNITNPYSRCITVNKLLTR